MQLLACMARRETELQWLTQMNRIFLRQANAAEKSICRDRRRLKASAAGPEGMVAGGDWLVRLDVAGAFCTPHSDANPKQRTMAARFLVFPLPVSKDK
jgi:hypothetical protein